MYAVKLPKSLKGPFVNAFYQRSEGIIYLKRPDGDVVSTRAYPSFFIRKEDRSRFPIGDYAGSILDWIDEGDYWRAHLDPEIKRETIEEMISTGNEVNAPILEADVSPVRRWFSDTGALVAQKFRCLFFDLETDPLRQGFDDEAKRQHRVISFAAYDQEGHSWFCAANKSSDEEEARVIKEFFRIAKGYDVLLAWNGDEYDFFVLRARCRHLKIKIDWRLWNWLDHMRVVKKLLSSIPDPAFKRSFALDKVGENVLGLRKLHTSVGGGQLRKLLGEKVGELEAYNRRDVEIMLGIEEKREFLVLQFALCSICRTFPNRGSTFPNSLADGTLLRLAVQENRHFKSRQYIDREEDEDKYEGAFVLDPKVGFHLNVQVPDFAGLYPSIIISWNMSNETKIEQGHEYPPNVAIDRAIATATGVSFRTDIEGIIPKALRQLISKRNEYKSRMKGLELTSEEYKNVDKLSTAVKVVTNSFYGLLGNEGSRYHDRDIARSVTLTGQLLIRECIKFFERKGFETVAGDTDSVFVKCSIQAMTSMLVEINGEFIPQLVNRSGCKVNTVKMEYDKGFKTLLIVTKKRYAGTLSLHKGRPAPADMKPEIKGLETQRSDIVRYAQRLQSKYITLLLDENVDPHVVDLALRKDGEEFYAATCDLESIVITKGISKHPSEYKPPTTASRIAQYLISSGHEFFVGMKIPYVVVAHKPNVIGIHADDYDGTFDRDYYWENLVLPPVLRLIESRFPNYQFSRFDKPLQGQFDFSNAMVTQKVPKVIMAEKIVKKVKKIVRSPAKIVRQVQEDVYTITIPESAGENAVKGIARMAKSFPGRYRLKLAINIPNLAEVGITTDQYVSMDCLREIAKLFTQVQISPNLL